MPYVLKHKETSEIHACSLINKYDIPYHGAKWWESREEAEHDHDDKEAWELLHVEERQLKLFNVKLNNNPNLKLFLDEQGKPFTRKATYL